VIWTAIPILAIIGIIFWKKQKTKESLVFASGLVLIAIGPLIQIFSPFGKMTIDEAGKVLSSSGSHFTWYLGSLVVSVGLIFTVIGFAGVTWKIKQNT